MARPKMKRGRRDYAQHAIGRRLYTQPVMTYLTKEQRVALDDAAERDGFPIDGGIATFVRKLIVAALNNRKEQEA